MIPRQHVRSRTYKGQVKPAWIDPADDQLLELAARLIDAYRRHEGAPREQLEETVEDELTWLSDLDLGRGLARLLENRADFETPPDIDPPALRAALFAAAAEARRQGAFDRQAVLDRVATETGVDAARLEADLYADLKSEQRLTAFKADISPRRLLERYNVGLAQALLLDAQSLTLTVDDNSARLRQLIRALKFHRLLFEVTSSSLDEDAAEAGLTLTIDGPMSLFGPTQKYGLQLANVLPTILLCRRFTLEAQLKRKKGRKRVILTLDDQLGLKSHARDHTYVPEEVRAFPERFASLDSDWTVEPADALFLLDGGRVAVPDLRFQPPGKRAEPVWLEMLGHWRRASAERHLKALAKSGPPRYVVAISSSLCLEERVPELADARVPVMTFKNVLVPRSTLKLLRELAAKGRRGHRKQARLIP